MMELSKWFDYQLQSTLDGFSWAFQQLPRERLHGIPPIPLGEWSAAQHLSHMLEYEEKLALPTMHQWLGAPPVVPEEGDENSKQSLPPIEVMLVHFKQVRKAEIGLLSKFEEDD